MPGFDRTGPSGQGPQTGRGLGKCGRAKGTSRSGLEQPARTLPETESSFNRGSGRGPGKGAGRGGGSGRGRGRM